MGCPNDMLFFPDDVVTAICANYRQHILKQWLTSKMNVVVTSVSAYCSNVCCFLKTTKDPKLVVSLCHFIYHSSLKNYIGFNEVPWCLGSLPVVDTYRNVVQCNKSLVPASGSRWMKLFGSKNAYTKEAYYHKYVVLGEVYGDAAEFAGECTPEKKLLEFFQRHSKACDLFDIFPEDAELKLASTQLTNDQALLLLDWIRNLRARKHSLPVRFIDSIKTGKSVKTYSGFSPPIRCFLCDGADISTLLGITKSVVVLSGIDQEYYRDKIRSFKDELMSVGVKMNSEDMHHLIANKLKHRASIGMTSKVAVSLLSFVKYSKDDNKLNDDFLKTLKEGKWLKTLKGYTAPSGSVFLASSFAEALGQIMDLNVADNIYYGGQLDSFMNELKLLGVLIDKGDVYKLLTERFIFPGDLSTMTKEGALVLLESIQHLGPSALGLIEKLRCKRWLKTSSGFSCLLESLLLIASGATC